LKGLCSARKQHPQVLEDFLLLGKQLPCEIEHNKSILRLDPNQTRPQSDPTSGSTPIRPQSHRPQSHRTDGAMMGFHFCLETDNFDETVAKLQKDGIALIRAPHDTAAREPRENGWRRVVFAGPDGEQIELRG